jgi:proteasome accessory factor B
VSNKVERLVNLTVALLETRRPLTFDQLRRRTGYYPQDDFESARRMFERDKDDLRKLGVPVDTRSLDAFDTEVGYTIDRDRYELPDIQLDADEVAALAIALQVTGEERARLGLVKLAARAPDPTDGLPQPQARVSLGTEAVDDVAEAIVERRAVQFGYRKADGSASTRTVDPYAVVQRRGHWYLVGRDHDRDDIRAFRVDRCTSRPTPTGDPHAYDVPDQLDVSAHVTGPAEDEVEAAVALAPDVAWEAASRGGVHERDLGEGWAVYRFAGTSPSRVVSWVLGLGASAELVEPPDLRERIVRHLQRVAGVAT